MKDETNLPGEGRPRRSGLAPECAVACRRLVVDFFAERGMEAHVTTVPPVVATPYEPLDMRCPHGVLWFAEPTGDQIAKWSQEGAR